MVLSPGQVILVYFVMGIAICTSIMVLCIEHTWKLTNRSVSKKDFRIVPCSI